MTYKKLRDDIFNHLLKLTKGGKLKFTHHRHGGWVFTITAKREE